MIIHNPRHLTNRGDADSLGAGKKKQKTRGIRTKKEVDVSSSKVHSRDQEGSAACLKRGEEKKSQSAKTSCFFMERLPPRRPAAVSQNGVWVRNNWSYKL